MRVIGIVTEVRQPPGLYMREGVAKPEDVAAASQRWVTASSAVGTGLGAVGVAGALGVANAALAAVMFAPVALPLGVALAAAHIVYRSYGGWFSKVAPLIRVPNVLESAGATDLSEKAILVSSALLGGQYNDYDAPLFHGLFSDTKALRTVMQAEGGNVDLVVIDQ